MELSKMGMMHLELPELEFAKMGLMHLELPDLELADIALVQMDLPPLELGVQMDLHHYFSFLDTDLKKTPTSHSTI